MSISDTISIAHKNRSDNSRITENASQIGNHLYHIKGVKIVVSGDERLRRLVPFILGKVNTRAALEGVLDEGYVWAGQVVGQINDVRKNMPISLSAAIAR